MIPLYDHITNCHMTVPYSIMYMDLCTEDALVWKLCGICICIVKIMLWACHQKKKPLKN